MTISDALRKSAAMIESGRRETISAALADSARAALVDVVAMEAAAGFALLRRYPDQAPFFFGAPETWVMLRDWRRSTYCKGDSDCANLLREAAEVAEGMESVDEIEKATDMFRFDN